VVAAVPVAAVHPAALAALAASAAAEVHPVAGLHIAAAWIEIAVAVAALVSHPSVVLKLQVYRPGSKQVEHANMAGFSPRSFD